jgi:hypothetical protein
MKKIEHPNIVRVFELYIDTSKNKIFTIMEYVKAQELFYAIRNFGFYTGFLIFMKKKDNK